MVLKILIDAREKFDKEWICVWPVKLVKSTDENPQFGISELMMTGYYKSSGTTWYEVGVDG